MNRSLTRSLTRGEEIPDQEILSAPSRMVPLVSEHVGLTTYSRPSLLFYISDPWPGNIEFALNEPYAKEPVAETYIKGPFRKGVYHINLADYNITLKPGIAYEWLIAIVLDPDERSADFIASATIRYAAPPENLLQKLGSASKNRLQFIYAENGYWYDAIENLSQQIDADPDNDMLRYQRIALLGQVNLPMAAAYDTGMLSSNRN